MYLHKLSLFNYKNFTEASFEFDSKINCLVGKNGIGKTNVLDAIYHLANGKSYFNPLAVQNIRHGEDFFVIDGEFVKQNQTEHVVCSLKKSQKKVLKRNGKLYEKLSEHVGLLPLVIISPSDRDLITEGSETRRKFIDAVISQLDTGYLHQLIQYQRLLTQRNALLKYFAINRVFDADTLSIYNEQMSEPAHFIFEKRQKFLNEFIPIFDKHYREIAGENESVSMTYESDLSQAGLQALLEQHLQKDRALQYTSVGIHKDDIHFEIGGYPIRKFGSQGQQKSFLIALKLAQFEFVKLQSGEKPILLFDDIFDKLDENRVAKIIEMVNRDTFGQLFLSDTHSDRTEDIVRSTHKSYKMFRM